MILLGILGTILKIIGILLLCILLLLLLILLVFLFVPLRYRAQVERGSGKLAAHAQVSYLFRIIRLPVDFEDGRLKIKLKIFGMTLFSNAEESGKKKGKADKRRKKKKKQEGEVQAQEQRESAGTEEGKGQPQDSGIQELDGGAQPQGFSVQELDDGKDGEKQEKKTAGGEESKSEASEQEDGGPGAETVHSTPDGEAGPDMAGGKMQADINGEVQADRSSTPDMPGTDAETPPQDSDIPKPDGSTQKEPEPESGAEPGQARGIFRLPGRIARGITKFVNQLRDFLRKLAGIYGKIKAALHGIMEKISAGKVKIADWKEKAGLVLSFLRDEENKNGIKYAGKSILRLLKHVFPYKIEGDIVFATGNAYSMGQTLAALGMLYPLYGKKIRLTADFEAEAFYVEGRVQIKGRIRFCTLLWIAFRLWQKGRIMRLLSAVKELKHKLTASAL